jgi:hypothetical protein
MYYRPSAAATILRHGKFVAEAMYYISFFARREDFQAAAFESTGPCWFAEW